MRSTMNHRDQDRRAEVAAQLLAALYPDAPHPGRRAAVLDALAAAHPDLARPAAPRPAQVAARALAAAYGTDTSEPQRAAVLDALAAARPRRGPAGPSRDALLALASTIAAALVLCGVIVGVRHESAQAPADGPAGLSAEAQRLVSAGARHPQGPRSHPAPRPGAPAPAAATPAATVHPAIAAIQRGCDQGSAVSCRRLGTLYQRGRGVAANRARAFELYDRACRAGDARGCALRDAADHSLNDVDRDDRADAEYFSTLGL